jgi:hypothetical protein
MSDLHAGAADAVLIPESMKRGQRMYSRVDSILQIVSPLLGVKFARGDTIWIKKQDGPKVGRREAMLFASRDLAASINYPIGDPKGRRGPRYDWVSDGSLALGYLKDPSDREFQISC